MRSRSKIVGAAALALALAVSGCGGGDDDDAADATTTTEEVAETTTTTEAEPEEETTTTSEAEEPDPDEPSLDVLVGILDPLLVTSEEISDQFTTGEWEASDSAPPCGNDPDVAYPPGVQTGTVLGSDDLGLYFQQDIRGYETPGDAAAVLELAREAFGCGTDTNDPSIQLGEVTDVSAAVGAVAIAVEVSVDGDPGSIVIAQYSDVVVSFQFQGDGDAASAAGIPAPLDVARFGMDKIITGLE